MTFDNTRILVDDCLMGKQAGYKGIYELFYSFAKNVCKKYTNNNEDTQEYINDSFIKAFKTLETYNKEIPFALWFRRILINTCIDGYRKKKNIFFDDINLNLSLSSMDESVLEKLNHSDLMTYLEQIHLFYRTPFLLFVVEGYTHKEIAKMLKISEITSRTAVNKGRVKLQKLIIDSYF